MGQAYLRFIKEKCEEKFDRAARTVNHGGRQATTVFLFRLYQEEAFVLSPEADPDDALLELHDYAAKNGISAVVTVTEVFLDIIEKEVIDNDSAAARSEAKNEALKRRSEDIKNSGREAIISVARTTDGDTFVLLGEVLRYAYVAEVVTKDWIDRENVTMHLFNPLDSTALLRI